MEVVPLVPRRSLGYSAQKYPYRILGDPGFYKELLINGKGVNMSKKFILLPCGVHVRKFERNSGFKSPQQR